MTLPPFGQDLAMTVFFVLALVLSGGVLYWAFVLIPIDKEQGMQDLLGQLSGSDADSQDK